MYLQQFFVEGRGCASYLISCEDAGVAAVIDPDRDIEKYLNAAAERRLAITHIIETHLHADHVSGNTDLAARTGASIYLLVIDVRETSEFAQGHVPGARLIPLGELGRRVAELDPRQPTAVICASGSRSQSAAAALGRSGFETVYNVLHGTLGWMQSGLPLENEPEGVR